MAGVVCIINAAAVAWSILSVPVSNRLSNTYVVARIADHEITRLDELLPWRYAQV
jgi:hypothetical protein